MYHYTFTFDDEHTIAFEVDETTDTSPEPPGPIPRWMLLETHRCAICSLSVDRQQTCPAAVACKPLVDIFDNRISYEKVHLKVVVDHFAFEVTLPIQNAARSLLGQQLALSSCPVLRKIRPLAFYHLPFGRQKHTAFRFIGMYLIGQHMRYMDGKSLDWDLSGLIRLFDQLHEVNCRLADRIRVASREDASVNSMIFLDAFAWGVRINVEQSFEWMRPLFQTYLEEE